MNPLFGLPGIASTGAVSRRKKSKPKSSGFKLAIVGGHIVKQLKGLVPLSASDKELFARLTTLHRYRMPYKGEQRGELFIHWFYRSRKADQLSKCEIFHLNMLQYFNVLDRVKVIHIRCASPNLSPTAAMLCAIEILSAGKATVDFKCVLPKDNWEHDTIKEAAEYAAASGEFVYYTHFKGASRNWGDLSFGGRKNHCPYTSLDLAYWSFIMYRGLFNDNAARHSVIGPIACDTINKEYLRLDLSWSTNSRYQYIGSFQGFDGKVLASAFERLGLTSQADRDKYIWWGGRYTVEMFLTLVFQESEVYSIAQKESTAAAYLMYAESFFPPYKKLFQQLYLQESHAREGSGVAICAVARNEDLYIAEWVRYYRKLGASHIYIYDNNDEDTPVLRQLASEKDVTVIPLHGQSALERIGYQGGAYADAYKRFGEQYAWMGFFDIDEFVEIDNGVSLPDFLDGPSFDGVTVVHLHWRYYGDGGRAKYSPEPLAVRFPDPAPEDVKYADALKPENRYVKSIVRTGYDCVNFRDVHAPWFYGAACRTPSGQFEYVDRSTAPVDLKGARVRHYGTKTIEEYIRRRIGRRRATGLKQISVKDRLDWFFRVNEMTSEKLQVIHEMLPDVKYP